jgi:DNA-binding response OmpR family regulator
VSGGRVLVVDDDAVVRDLLDEYLKQCGYEVTIAGTAFEALDVMRTDVVLLDLNMPGPVGGAAVVNRLAAEVPVIILTGSGDVEIAVRTLHAGAFDFLMKPVDLKHLAERVKSAIGGGASRPHR